MYKNRSIITDLQFFLNLTHRYCKLLPSISVYIIRSVSLFNIDNDYLKGTYGENQVTEGIAHEPHQQS